MPITHISGKIETVQTLPRSEETINLALFETWDDLDERQQYFLSLYFRYYPSQTKSQIEAGIKSHTLQTWIKQHSSFKETMNLIEELHRENLSSIHYRESYANPQIRKDVLRSIGAKGYDGTKNTKTTNILNTDQKSLPELLKALT